MSFPLTQLYFYLSKDCNLRCGHCYITPTFLPEKKVAQGIAPEVFASVIKQAKPLGLSGVKLTGGEPLIHPQIAHLLEIIHDEQVQLVIETNGTRLAKPLVRQIARCRNPFVSVSLDGAVAATHDEIRGVPGSYEQTLEGIRNLVEAGVTTQIIMSISRRNYGQMKAMIALGESLGVESVKYNIVMPSGRGDLMHRKGVTLSIYELVEIGHEIETVIAPKTPLRVHYDHPPAFRPLHKMFSGGRAASGVCGIHSILGVLHDGTLAMCGVGKAVPALVYGHAERDALADVWNHAPGLLELREGIPNRLEGVCSRCVMRARCFGSCVANNVQRSGSLFAPFWYCEAAEEAGLFPTSRLELEPTMPAATSTS